MERDRRRETNIDAVENAGAVPASLALGRVTPRRNTIPGPVSYAYLRVSSGANEILLDPAEPQFVRGAEVAKLRNTAFCLEDGITVVTAKVMRTAYPGEEV